MGMRPALFARSLYIHHARSKAIMRARTALPNQFAVRRVTWMLIAAVASVACASSNVDVQTQVAPQANFGSYRTFSIMTPRNAGRGENPASQADPMLNNSITNQALHGEIRQRLEASGYQPGGRDADLGVAVYAASRQTLDVTTVDYGYPYRPWWWGPRQEVRPVTQGTVVIDVVDRHANRLVWRGVGRSEVSDNPDDYAKDLRTAVDAVLKKLPKAGS